MFTKLAILKQQAFSVQANLRFVNATGGILHQIDWDLRHNPASDPQRSWLVRVPRSLSQQDGNLRMFECKIKISAARQKPRTLSFTVTPKPGGNSHPANGQALLLMEFGRCGITITQHPGART